MNIRSMIKHVAAIITAVGMLLASMAGAVTALAEDSKPTTAVDGPTKPVRIMDNLYQTRYTGDYKLDDYLSANAGGNDDYLAWLRANLNHGKPIPLSTTQACTTLAVTDTDTGHDLMVRNMDWYPAVPGMMVATAPTDGYRSVGVAPVMTGKANATPTTDELETSANIAPLTTMDGVNEKGLSAAILQIHRWQAPNDGKPSIKPAGRRPAPPGQSRHRGRGNQPARPVRHRRLRRQVRIARRTALRIGRRDRRKGHHRIRRRENARHPSYGHVPDHHEHDDLEP